MYDKLCYTLSHYCKWYMQLFQNGPVTVWHVPGVTHHLYYCSLKHTHLLSLVMSRSHQHLPSAHKLLVAVFVSLCHHIRNTSMKKGTKMVCGTKHVHMRFLLHLQLLTPPGCCDNKICFSFCIITCYYSIIMFNSHCQIKLL